MDILSGLTAIQSAMTCAKGLSAAIKAIKETDQKIALMDAREQLTEMQERLLDIRDQINALIQENQNLREQLKLKDEMRLQEDGNILWRMEKDKTRGPYCSACFGRDEKCISLSARLEPGAWSCPVCKNFFHTRQWDIDRKEEHQALRKSHGYY